jgi:hypothetical protein
MIKNSILFLIIFSFFQNNNENIKDINIFIRHHNARYPILATTDNFMKEKLYQYTFNLDGLELGVVADNFNQFKKELMDGEKLINKEKLFINSCVEINYSFMRKIIIYFDKRGNYYFEGFWYKPNYSLYYKLFKYFSNELVPQKTIMVAMHYPSE